MNLPADHQSLTAQTLADGVAFLSSFDPKLAQIHSDLGSPPLWERQPGFPTLVYIILEQQVSLASARAAFNKLQAAAPVTPETFLRFDDAELKAIGFSGQKAGYCRGLAQAVLNGEFDIDELARLDDAAARAALIRIKGIGPWTADIYLLMALLRPDIWPAGDLALAVAYKKLMALPARPGAAELERIAEPWKPWRAVAARLLWHYYLSDSFRV